VAQAFVLAERLNPCQFKARCVLGIFLGFPIEERFVASLEMTRQSFSGTCEACSRLTASNSIVNIGRVAYFAINSLPDGAVAQMDRAEVS
jgi:hypothetical protein